MTIGFPRAVNIDYAGERVNEVRAEVVLVSVGKDANPTKARYTIEARNLRDPFGQIALTTKFKNGTAKDVQAWVKADPRLIPLGETIRIIAHTHIRHMQESYVTIAIEDHHGRWLAPALVEIFTDVLVGDGFKVCPVHRGLE